MDKLNPYEAIQQGSQISLSASLIDDAPTTYVEPVQEVGEVYPQAIVQGEESKPETKRGSFPRDKNEFVRRKFAEWLSTPKKVREPSTQQDFAALYGVHPATLSGWKHDPEFHQNYVDRVKREISYRVVDALDAAMNKAEAGDLDALESTLEAIDWKQDKPQTVTPVSVNLSLQQLISQTEEPSVLPSWQRKTLEAEEVG